MPGKGTVMKLTKDMIENLKCTGCPDTEIRRIGEMENEDVQLQALNCYRKCLLECVHAEQKKLEYLDYLIYEIKKKKDK